MHSTTQHTVHIHIHTYTHTVTHTPTSKISVSPSEIERHAAPSRSLSLSLPDDSLSRLRGASPPSYHATSLNRQCTPRTGLLPATQHRPADRASPSTAFPVQLFYLFWTRGQGEGRQGQGGRAGQGRAITGPRLFGCSFDAFLLTHIPKRRRNKTKSKTSPRLGPSPIGSSIRHM